MQVFNISLEIVTAVSNITGGFCSSFSFNIALAQLCLQKIVFPQVNFNKFYS